MRRNPPDRYFSAYARGRSRRAPGLIQSKGQRRVARLVRKTRRMATKHRYDWIPEEGIAPGQNPRRRRNAEQLPLIWREYEYMGSTIQEQRRGRWKVYTKGGSVSPTLTSKRAAERWAKVYGTKIENSGRKPMAKKRRKTKTRRVKQTTVRARRNSARTRRRRRPARRRNARKITFPIPVTPREKKKVGSWLRRHFGKRIKVR